MSKTFPENPMIVYLLLFNSLIYFNKDSKATPLKFF